MPFKKLNWTKLENKTIYKIPTTHISWNELDTLQAMINIMCLLTELTRRALYGQMPLIITQLSTRDLVSMGTEGNITPLFFDGSFIISIFEKWFFKMIEAIKYTQLCITLEIESAEFWNIPLVLLIFQQGKGHWLGEQPDILGKGSQYPVFLEIWSLETSPGSFRHGADFLPSVHQIPVDPRALVNSGRKLSPHIQKSIKSGEAAETEIEEIPKEELTLTHGNDHSIPNLYTPLPLPVIVLGGRFLPGSLQTAPTSILPIQDSGTTRVFLTAVSTKMHRYRTIARWPGRLIHRSRKRVSVIVTLLSRGLWISEGALTHSRLKAGKGQSPI